VTVPDVQQIAQHCFCPAIGVFYTARGAKAVLTGAMDEMGLSTAFAGIHHSAQNVCPAHRNLIQYLKVLGLQNQFSLGMALVGRPKRSDNIL